MIGNDGSSRINICIDPSPRSPTAGAPRKSEMPHLAASEFRTGAHCGLSSDFQTSAPAGTTHNEVTS